MTVNLRKRTIPWPLRVLGRPPPIKCPQGPSNLATGDQSIIDQAFDQIEDAGDYDALTRYIKSLPELPDIGMPVQAFSPAGVGSPGSQSYRSIQTSPESSGGRTPASPPSVPLAAGARTAAGAGGDGNGSGRGVVVVPGLEVVDVVDVVVVVVDVAVLVVLVMLVVVVVVVVAVVVVVVVAVVVGAVAVVVDDVDDEPHFTCLHLSRILDVWEFWQTASHLESSGFTTTFTDDVTRSRTIGPRT